MRLLGAERKELCSDLSHYFCNCMYQLFLIANNWILAKYIISFCKGTQCIVWRRIVFLSSRCIFLRLKMHRFISNPKSSRNRTSLIMRCYSLLVDIVYFNPFRNIRDMTTMTNKSSKIWPNYDQPFRSTLFHISQQFLRSHLHLVEGKPSLAEVLQWSTNMINCVVDA